MIAYLAPEGFTDELIAELGVVSAVYGRLVVVEQSKDFQPVWAQNTWLNPVYLPVSSVSSAVKQLRALQLRWANYAFHLYRRTELIQTQLPALKNPALEFLGPLPVKPIGSWTLVAEDSILASTNCSSRFPNGEVHFQENKSDPPSRAYLKLWELFTVYGVKPQPGEVCLDLGSSPGGWTWVLEQLQCAVISVDKAPLDPRLQKSPRVRYLERSAFSIIPDEIGKINWFFSDVICYPARLLRLVKAWLQSGLCENFVCTLKLQGETDFAVLKEFAEIPGSRILHLYHNKHELTWVRKKGSSPEVPSPLKGIGVKLRSFVQFPPLKKGGEGGFLD
jgi:23S rRNA (cytidine2498-2'-O)-methyltransferase